MSALKDFAQWLDEHRTATFSDRPIGNPIDKKDSSYETDQDLMERIEAP
jgi:hypothetical protein